MRVLAIFFLLFSSLTAEEFPKWDPVDLVRPERFDVMAKYIFAWQLNMGIQSTWGEEIYREHLRVFNGFYEQEPKKHSYEDFRKAFFDVYTSVQNEGGLDRPLPVSPEGILVDGSHRLAFCLVNQFEVPCQQDPMYVGSNFSSEFFRNASPKGLEERYLDSMAISYCDLKSESKIVIVFPAAQGKHSDVETLLNTYGKVVYRKNISFQKEAPWIFTRELYEAEPWLGTWSNQFGGLTAKPQLVFLRR